MSACIKNPASLFHKSMFEQHQLEYHLALKTSREAYYSHMINQGAANPRTLFKIISNLLKPPKKSICPSDEMCNNFNKYFNEKVHSIYSSISSVSPVLTSESLSKNSLSTSFTHFATVSINNVLELVMTMSSSTCFLDPLPTEVLKKCLPHICPSITSIINNSLATGQVPPALKMAAITPVLKKTGCDVDNLSNYRPIANLPFLAKILERVVVGQLQQYLSKNNLLEPFQSGFRSGHSTETALVRVTNDLLVAADMGACSILVLLDVSAAFDTILYVISSSLTGLRVLLGISAVAFEWFESYLTDRFQYICLGKNKSEATLVQQGVPQGSVLGPTLFCIYMLLLGDIIRKYDCYFVSIVMLMTLRSMLAHSRTQTLQLQLLPQSMI